MKLSTEATAVSVRIELDEPEFAENLASFLVDAGYIADPVDGGAIDARRPLADEATAARDLALILRTWCAERGRSPNGVVISHPRW